MAGLEGSTLMIDLSIVGIYSFYLTTLVSNKIRFYFYLPLFYVSICSYCNTEYWVVMTASNRSRLPR